MVENREDIETQNLEEFRNLIAEKKYTALREKAKDMNDSDLAYIMDNMEDEDMLTMFRLFPKELAADVFSQLTLESQQYIITSLSEKEAGSIIDNLFADDATDLLEEMPANVVKKILSNAKPETRKDINHLLQYSDDSAGSVMTTEFMDLKEKMTVKEVEEAVKVEKQIKKVNDFMDKLSQEITQIDLDFSCIDFNIDPATGEKLYLTNEEIEDIKSRVYYFHLEFVNIYRLIHYDALNELREVINNEKNFADAVIGLNVIEKISSSILGIYIEF